MRRVLMLDISAEDDRILSGKAVEFKEFEVSIYNGDPESGDVDDIVIYIDTPPDFKKQLRIYINDALLYKGNPEKPEEVAHNDLDGYYIIDKQ